MGPLNRPAQQGQGVVEYAGALVIATVLIVGVMGFAPEGLAGVFSNIYDTVSNVINAALASL